MVELSLDRFWHPVEISHFIEKTVHAALGARSIVADDVEDECIVQLAEIFQCGDQAANLGIGIFAEPGEHLHLTGEQSLLICAQRGPILDRLGRATRNLTAEASIYATIAGRRALLR